MLATDTVPRGAQLSKVEYGEFTAQYPIISTSSTGSFVVQVHLKLYLGVPLRIDCRCWVGPGWFESEYVEQVEYVEPRSVAPPVRNTTAHR